MRQKILILLGSVVLVFLIVIPWKQTATPPTPKRPMVAASLFPAYDLVRSVAGDALEVRLILPPGASPHTFEPSPKKAEELIHAKVAFVIGEGLDDWIRHVLPEAARVVPLSKGISLLAPHELAVRGVSEDTDDPMDPHYWLDPQNAIKMVGLIQSELATEFPEQTAAFEKNAAKKVASIQAADEEAVRLLASVPSRSLITFHDAWYYFAKHFDLTIAASFEPTAGREPTPQYLEELGATTKKVGIRTIFDEAQSSNAAILSFADDNGLQILTLDDIGGVSPSDSYENLILSNARTISKNR
ncbi:zinc ABC transporter substrate-binding protein [Candidatus Uhrbacteria bacterium]|nr:zinc ABC transporter substrate-binding protein [Candidatus Uhrbacteria bacterium]